MPTQEDIKFGLENFPKNSAPYNDAVIWQAKLEEFEKKEKLKKEEELKKAEIETKKTKILNSFLENHELYRGKDKSIICQKCNKIYKRDWIVEAFKAQVDDNFKVDYVLKVNVEDEYGVCPACKGIEEKDKLDDAKHALQDVTLGQVFDYIPDIYADLKFNLSLALRDYETLKTNSGIYLYGPTGTGKTFRVYNLLCFLRSTYYRLMARDAVIGFEFTNLITLMIDLKSDFKNVDKAIRRLSSVQVLFLDDFGVEMGTPIELNYLYEIINRRYEYELTTVFTSNYKLSEWITKNGDVGLRIGSRIKGSCAVIEIENKKDLRLKS